jgi:hypothetical protein
MAMKTFQSSNSKLHQQRSLQQLNLFQHNNMVIH